MKMKMKTLEVLETVRYKFIVPDHVTEDTAEDWFTDLVPRKRDNGCQGVLDRTWAVSEEPIKVYEQAN
jgi:hypothetical protein